MTLPRPVEPNVSIAKYSPSSILVWSSFFTRSTDLPPWIWYGLMEWPLRFSIGLTVGENMSVERYA